MCYLTCGENSGRETLGPHCYSRVTDKEMGALVHCQDWQSCDWTPGLWNPCCRSFVHPASSQSRIHLCLACLLSSPRPFPSLSFPGKTELAASYTLTHSLTHSLTHTLLGLCCLLWSPGKVAAQTGRGPKLCGDSVIRLAGLTSSSLQVRPAIFLFLQKAFRKCRFITCRLPD